MAEEQRRPDVGKHIYQDPAGTVCFERADLVRIVAKFLDDMGYSQTASQLESESGIKCQSSSASECLHYLAQGQWSEALELLTKVKLQEDSVDVQRLVLERKFAEYLEQDNVLTALQCLRIEICPMLVNKDTKQSQLEKLARCILCSPTQQSSLTYALGKVGHHAFSRLELTKAVKEAIAPSELVPSGTLESFVADAIRSPK